MNKIPENIHLYCTFSSFPSHRAPASATVSELREPLPTSQDITTISRRDSRDAKFKFALLHETFEISQE